MKHIAIIFYTTCLMVASDGYARYRWENPENTASATSKNVHLFTMVHEESLGAAMPDTTEFFKATTPARKPIQESTNLPAGNQPGREEWLRDAGFGMFIHWNIDTQLGTVISHSLVGASSSYIEKYLRELPQTFLPKNWDPEKLVILAKNAGMKYIMFTAKHHAGFCMWNTKTTDFSVTQTPYRKDILASVAKACRKYGLAFGIYFSPEDFAFCYRIGIKTITRDNHWQSVYPIREKYLDYTLAQIKELMTQYGKVDLFFIDSKVMVEEVKQAVWKWQPDCLITRGEIPTPEQYMPGEAIAGAWESNMTMGTQWNYKPTNEYYKSGTELINLLIRARARGGTFLLNIGPDQWGNLNEAQQGRLMEIGAWNFINHEAIQNVVPWIVPREKECWFSQSKDSAALYVYVTGHPQWVRGSRKEFLLRSVRATDSTKIGVLGQTGDVVEYFPQIDGRARWTQTDSGLLVSVVRAQRIYNNHQWPNPIVIKLENVVPALVPAAPVTDSVQVHANGVLRFAGKLKNKVDDQELLAGFEYRRFKSSLEPGDQDEWKRTALFPVTGPKLSVLVEDALFQSGGISNEKTSEGPANASQSKNGIEYRFFVIQNGLKIDGNTVSLKVLL